VSDSAARIEADGARSVSDLVKRGVWQILTEHWWTASLVLLLLVSANLIAQRLFHWSEDFIAFEALMAVLTLALPGIARSLVRWADALAEPIVQTFVIDAAAATGFVSRQLEALLPRWEPILIGVCLAGMGVVSGIVFGIPWSGWIGVLFYVWLVIFLFGYGAVAWEYGVLLRILWLATTHEARCTPFRWPKEPIRAIHRIYTHSLLVGVMLYALAISAVWLSPGGAEIARHTRLGPLWVFPPAAGIISYLITYNSRLHSVLARCKRTAAEEIEEALAKAYGDWRSAPARDGEARISDLLKWRDSIAQQPAWPMDLRGVAAMVTTLLLPTIKAVIDLMRH